MPNVLRLKVFVITDFLKTWQRTNAIHPNGNCSQIYYISRSKYYAQIKSHANSVLIYMKTKKKMTKEQQWRIFKIR